MVQKSRSVQAPYHSGICGVIDKRKHKGFRNRQNLPRRHKKSLHAGIELLFLSGRGRRVSFGRTAGFPCKIRHKFSLLYFGYFRAFGTSVRKNNLRFLLSGRFGAGTSPQNQNSQTEKEPFHPRAFVLKIRAVGCSGNSNPHNLSGNTGLLQVCLSRRHVRRRGRTAD